MKRNIFVVGTFGYFNNKLDGQTVKTRNIYDLLKTRHDGKVSFVDTLEVKKKPWLLFSLLWNLICCNKLVLVPCTNNLTILFPVVYYLSMIFRYEIILICMGGWQVEFFYGSEKFSKHPYIMKLCKKVKVLMPELKRVDDDLKKVCGFKNTVYFPNFRFIENKDYKYSKDESLRLVYFGRINRNKGYETIMNAVDYFESQHLSIKIDFYGQIEEEDRLHFMDCVKTRSAMVDYKGELPFEILYETLATYDMLLFPTRYYTEGFPGCILDAFISGIPVLVTDWKHSHEFVHEGKTGFIVPFENNQDKFNSTIVNINNDRDHLTNMREMAKKESLNYSDEVAWSIIQPYL